MLAQVKGCEGIKTPSTQKVVTAHTKAYSKINSDDKVAILMAGNTMKQGTQDIDVHARGTAYLNALAKSVEKLYGLKGIIEGLFGNDPNALMATHFFHNQGVLVAGKGGLCSPRLRLRVRSGEERLEVHQG